MLFNLGSINIDLVYRVATLPKPGETLSSSSFEQFLGGKGVNQSIAAAKGGAQTCHIGAVGPDGDWALGQVRGFGLETDHISHVEAATGHAVIAVDDGAENLIILHGGANQSITKDMIDAALQSAKPSDFVLCQNETNLTEYLAKRVSELGAKLVLSAAPFDAAQVTALRHHIHLLAVNETEASDLAEAFGQAPEDMGFPMLLVTKGSKGASVFEMGRETFQASFAVTPVDTTGAGDTFLGSFVARLDQGEDVKTALRYASAAAANQVTRKGAATAIPDLHEVQDFLKEQS